MATITSANSIIMLKASGLFPVPVQIQGFSSDDAWLMEDSDTAETMMGVDGKLSAGYTPTEKPFEINLQADSPSNDFFDTIVAAEDVAMEKYQIDGTVQIKGTKRLYALTVGFIKTPSRMPAGKKVLQPRKFRLVFQSITWAPLP